MNTSLKAFRRAWTLGWLGAAGLAVVNGALRDLLYSPLTGELAARQLSTVSLLILLAAYLWWLDQRWPIPAARVAAVVGVGWTATTLAFEFGLGHFVEHKSWTVLLSDYDITSGRIWLLIPIWVAIGPAVVRRRRIKRTDSPTAHHLIPKEQS
jgi:hypothetical protein